MYVYMGNIYSGSSLDVTIIVYIAKKNSDYGSSGCGCNGGRVQSELDVAIPDHSRVAGRRRSSQPSG